MRIFSLAALFCGATFGQSQSPAETPLAFEVASVKSTALPAGGCGYRMEGGPGSSDPGRVELRNISLAALVRLAYLGNIHACESYWLSAPAWLDSEGFEIVAKLPPGTTWPQEQLMLLNLVVERFKLAIHREPKVISAYALVVGKNGPKFKESVENSAPDGANENASVSQSAHPPKATTDNEGFPVPAPAGSWTIRRNNHTRMQLSKVEVVTLARQLRNQLGVPVTDAYREWFRKSVEARQKAGVSAPGESADVFTYVPEYNDPQRFKRLADDLVRRGWPSGRVEKLLGANFARLFVEVWDAPRAV